MKYIFFSLLFIGCNFPLLDFEQTNNNSNDPDWVDMVDTIQEPITVEPCTDSLYLEPAFVTGWWYIPEPIGTDLELCAGTHCVIVQDGEDIAHILDSLISELYPSFVNSAYQIGQKVSLISEGTNDINLFHGKVWYRPVNYHSGWGFAIQKQAYAFLGSVTFDEYMAIIDLYPSARYISFRYFDWTADQYVKAALKILECREGRDIIDFRGITLNTGEQFTMPDSIIQMAIDADWNDVRF